MKKVLVSVALLSLFSAPAMAGKTGVYAGLDYHSIELTADGDKFNLGALGATAGYQINENFAVEARASTGVKKADVGAGVNLDIKNYVGVQAVGLLPLTKEFSVYGTLGYGRLELGLSGGGTSAKESENSVSYGIGVQYNIEPVAVRLGYENLYDKDGLRIDGVKLSGLYAF